MELDFSSINTGLRDILRPFKRNPGRALKYALLRAAMERFPERKLFCPMPFKMIEIERGEQQSLLLAPEKPRPA